VLRGKLHHRITSRGVVSVSQDCVGRDDSIEVLAERADLNLARLVLIHKRLVLQPLAKVAPSVKAGVAVATPGRGWDRRWSDMPNSQPPGTARVGSGRVKPRIAVMGCKDTAGREFA